MPQINRIQARAVANIAISHQNQLQFRCIPVEAPCTPPSLFLSSCRYTFPRSLCDGGRSLRVAIIGKSQKRERERGGARGEERWGGGGRRERALRGHLAGRLRTNESEADAHGHTGRLQLTKCRALTLTDSFVDNGLPRPLYGQV